MAEVNEFNWKQHIPKEERLQSGYLSECARKHLQTHLARQFPAHTWRLAAGEGSPFADLNYRMELCPDGSVTLQDLGPYGPGLLGQMRKQSASRGPLVVVPAAYG